MTIINKIIEIQFSKTAVDKEYKACDLPSHVSGELIDVSVGNINFANPIIIPKSKISKNIGYPNSLFTAFFMPAVFSKRFFIVSKASCKLPLSSPDLIKSTSPGVAHSFSTSESDLPSLKPCDAANKNAVSGCV